MDHASGGTCGHRCPAHPAWPPCGLPAGHDPEGGHKDSATYTGHTWQDHGHDVADSGLVKIMLESAAAAFEADPFPGTDTTEGA